jgi:hypothetical protein
MAALKSFLRREIGTVRGHAYVLFLSFPRVGRLLFENALTFCSYLGVRLEGGERKETG